MSAEYDFIGKSYTQTRQADPRIVEKLRELLALPERAKLLEVGAGTGNYSAALARAGFEVHALEPSSVMRSQAATDTGVNWVAGCAEHIPFGDSVFDGVFVVLAFHHFADQRKAVSEMLRVAGPGPLVIFSWAARILPSFWLCDYFPGLVPGPKDEAGDVERAAENIRRWTGRRCKIKAFPLPNDLQDNFAAANWSKPEAYLRSEIRAGISSFSARPAADFQDGLAALEADLQTGRWDKRYGHLRRETEYDAGYRFLKVMPQAG